MSRSLCLLAVLLCCLPLCGCGVLHDSAADSGLEKARERYEKSLADASQETATATKSSADTLTLIAEKLDQVIENTSSRRSRAAGAVADDETFPVSTPVSQSPVVEGPPDALIEPEIPSPPVAKMSADEVTAVPASSGEAGSVSQSLGHLASRFEEIANRLDAPRSSPTSGNDIRTPDGSSVNVKEYIADNGTNRFAFEGDVAAQLASLGFNADEVDCLKPSEQHKLYDAWLSAHPPASRAVAASPAASVAAPRSAAPRSQCYRIGNRWYCQPSR